MDISTIVAWIQLALWSLAVVVFIVRLIKRWGKEGGMTVPLRGLYLALAFGLVISLVSLYLNYRPRIVEKTIEKPVDRIVEREVVKPCPKQSCPIVKSEQKSRAAPPQSKDGMSIGELTQQGDINQVGNNDTAVEYKGFGTSYNYDCTIERETNAGGSNITKTDICQEFLDLESAFASSNWESLHLIATSAIAKRPAWSTPHIFEGFVALQANNLPLAKGELHRAQALVPQDKQLAASYREPIEALGTKIKARERNAAQP